MKGYSIMKRVSKYFPAIKPFTYYIYIYVIVALCDIIINNIYITIRGLFYSEFYYNIDEFSEYPDLPIQDMRVILFL